MDNFLIIKKMLEVLGQSNNIDYIIIKCLDLLINEMHYDRVYVYFDNLRNESKVYESVSRDSFSRKHNHEIDHYSYFFHLVTEYGSEIESDIDSETDERLRFLMTRNQQRSINLKPIYCESEVLGYIGVDNCSSDHPFTTLDRVIIDVLSIISTNILLRLRQLNSLSEKNHNLLTLMDNLGGIAYAVDIKTHEILFANEELKKVFNRNVEGEICYKVFQNRDSVCDFCTTPSLLKEEDAAVSYEFHNEVLDKTYLLSDRLIELHNGKKARFEIGIDITEKIQLRDRIADESNKLETIISSIGSLLIALDGDLQITLVNGEAESYLGSELEGLLGHRLSDFLTVDLDESDIAAVLREFEKTDESRLNFRSKLINRNLNELPCDITVSKIRDAKDSRCNGFVIIVSDLTEYYRNVGQIERLHKTDFITGAITRRYFEQSLIQQIILSDCTSLSIFICDINGLKLINDLLSHQKGDELLFHVCNLIKSVLPDESHIVRWGGDEFLVYMENIDEDETEALIEDLKQRIEELDYELPVSVSFGYEIANAIEYSEIFNAIHIAEDHLNRHKLLEGSSNRSFIINSMKKSLYAKSNETEEHASRLRNLSGLLAEEMMLGMGLRDEIELLAQLHDIGKISISDNILLKPSSLTENEWKIMKTHSEAGYRILNGIPGLSQIALYVLCHHERWDGGGYPQGLKGEEIPLPSRIIAIADTFDAMTQDRVYHKAESTEAAIEEILRCAGTQFDPDIVRVFERVSMNLKDKNKIKERQ